ncbi:MAG TPA: glycosyltransferase [Candidatus Cloacimonadota bacterium]|nr:glycosyltransferase [Candidatus Cloacimonadota bacterium]
MKRILHLQLLPLLSGVQNFSLHLLDGLDPNEFEITIASSAPGALVEACRERGWNHIAIKGLRHPVNPLDLIGFLHIFLILKRGKYDIVHTNSSKPGLLGRLAARLLKVPLILHTCHGTPFQQGQAPIVYWLYVHLEKLANSWGDMTVYVNHSDRKAALKLGLISSEKATTIYNAIPPGLEQRLRQIGTDRLKRGKAAEDSLIIGSTLRFSEQKNALQLTISACKACRKNQRLKFIILGGGEQYFLCRQIVRSYGLTRRILLPGFDPEIASWLEKFDAFILYSRWEAQPFSIIEAMHSGLPVIGSDIPSIAELVDESTGYLVPLAHPEELEKLLSQLAEDFSPALLKGQQGMKAVKAKCDYHTMVESYLKLYRGEKL